MSGAPRVFAAWSERPLAYTCVVLAATGLVWKTVGLGFVPGWEEMFGGVGAQYPRRPEALSPAWGLAYLLVYGVLGTAATAGGLLITRRRGPLTAPAGVEVVRWARVHGLLHTVIGLHHTVWGLTAGAWGHLALEQFEVPGLYIVGAFGGGATGLHGLRLLTSSATHATHRIVRSKIVVDGVSCLTFLSVFVCFPMNALGMPRAPGIERLSWVMVFVGPVLWLLADLVVSRETRRAPAA